jgi:hypothetical protein
MPVADYDDYAKKMTPQIDRLLKRLEEKKAI